MAAKQQQKHSGKTTTTEAPAEATANALPEVARGKIWQASHWFDAGEEGYLVTEREAGLDRPIAFVPTNWGTFDDRDAKAAAIAIAEDERAVHWSVSHGVPIIDLRPFGHADSRCAMPAFVYALLYRPLNDDGTVMECEPHEARPWCPHFWPQPDLSKMPLPGMTIGVIGDEVNADPAVCEFDEPVCLWVTEETPLRTVVRAIDNLRLMLMKHAEAVAAEVRQNNKVTMTVADLAAPPARPTVEQQAITAKVLDLVKGNGHAANGKAAKRDKRRLAVA